MRFHRVARPTRNLNLVPGVADVNVIDLLAQDGDGRYLAVMVEERAWGSDPNQSVQLREKFNSYATFIADGQYSTRVPESAGERVTIQLRCPEPPTGEFAAMLDFVTTRLDDIGIGVEIKVVDYL